MILGWSVTKMILHYRQSSFTAVYSGTLFYEPYFKVSTLSTGSGSCYTRIWDTLAPTQSRFVDLHHARWAGSNCNCQPRMTVRANEGPSFHSFKLLGRGEPGVSHLVGQYASPLCTTCNSRII